MLILYEAQFVPLDFNLRIYCAFATPHVVIVPVLTDRKENKGYEENEKCSQIFALLVTPSYAGVAGVLAPATEKE